MIDVEGNILPCIEEKFLVLSTDCMSSNSCHNALSVLSCIHADGTRRFCIVQDVSKSLLNQWKIRQSQNAARLLGYDLVIFICSCFCSFLNPLLSCYFVCIIS